MNRPRNDAASDATSEATKSESSDPPVALPSPQDDALITHVTHRAMATDFVVMLPQHAAGAVEVVVEALEMLDGIESKLTIYRAESEISRVNLLGAEGPVPLSQDTFALLQRSIRWSERTSGAFDVTAGPLIEVWGFTRRRGRKPNQTEIQTAQSLVGFQKLVLDPDKRSVQFGTPGMSINLGAIGKGEALDRLADHLRASGLTDFLIHGGNSSLIAAGDQIRGSGQGWAVGLAHPTKPQRRLGGLWLRNRALSTSGSGKQFFHHQGRRFGHVIDPRTGYPAGDLLSLTVMMESAADADACSTGLFVAGSGAIRQLVENTAELESNDDPWEFSPMILAGPGKRQDEVDVETLGHIDWIDTPIQVVTSGQTASLNGDFERDDD